MRSTTRILTAITFALALCTQVTACDDKKDDKKEDKKDDKKDDKKAE